VPADRVFRTTIRVLYGDTDAGGVVYNANYLRYFEFGRTELMRTWVCSYRDIEQQGFVLPVTECWTRYKAPAFYDDLLHIETTIARVTDFTCQFNYRILRADGNTGKPRLLVKGYTIHAAITREGHLTRLPIEIMNKIKLLSANADNKTEDAE
jgi:acyl-CoA thioester hydrolase